MGMFSFFVILFGGILAGIAVAGLIVYLINGLLNIPLWLKGAIGFFLFFFLSFQFVAIGGAMKVKEAMENMIALNATAGDIIDWNAIKDEYPVLRPYLDNVGMELGETCNKQKSIFSFVNKVINEFMWRRGAWVLGGAVACFVIAVVSDMLGSGRMRQSRQHGTFVCGRSSAPVRRSCRARRR